MNRFDPKKVKVIDGGGGAQQKEPAPGQEAAMFAKLRRVSREFEKAETLYFAPIEGNDLLTGGPLRTEPFYLEGEFLPCESEIPMTLPTSLLPFPLIEVVGSSGFYFKVNVDRSNPSSFKLEITRSDIYVAPSEEGVSQ